MTSRLARWGQMLGRSGDYVRQEMNKTRQVLDPTAIQKTKLLHRFRSEKDVEKWTHGSDESFGGLSTSKLELAMDGRGMRFHGDLRLGVKPEYEGIFRGGFAGIKTRARPTLFGNLAENLSMYEYLGLRVKVGKPPCIRDAWYINLRTKTMDPNHVWQHRLFLRSTDGEFEDAVVRLDDFGYTASGNMVETIDEMEMESIEMLGVSLLGGNAGLQGPYELTIDEIWATNDPTATPRRN
ncbi:related to complex I intermediate-associated protein CIA30 precursor, mitochondrial [Serendipita indica DSM 11827]|uniref:Related to complex I intermediate-associated protein CIA30, mitochondrial n=1 Tax=Serendipita indica (strain DSM 11827) TaxID=1109443 RepID=G4THI7_SERID|nr:related to complex I intermediate-associated protein CIA30 precursor, mitochondrial [Serendipita indica DSM 11827]